MDNNRLSGNFKSSSVAGTISVALHKSFLRAETSREMATMCVQIGPTLHIYMAFLSTLQNWFISDNLDSLHVGRFSCCTDCESDASGLHHTDELPKNNKCAAPWPLLCGRWHKGSSGLPAPGQHNPSALLLLPSAPTEHFNLLFTTCSPATCFSLKHWHFNWNVSHYNKPGTLKALSIPLQHMHIAASCRVLAQLSLYLCPSDTEWSNYLSFDFLHAEH